MKAPKLYTSGDLDALPSGSVVAYLGNEPASPSVACKTGDNAWQFLGEHPDHRRRSTDLANPTRSGLELRLIHNPDWYAFRHQCAYQAGSAVCVICGWETGI